MRKIRTCNWKRKEKPTIMCLVRSSVKLLSRVKKVTSASDPSKTRLHLRTRSSSYTCICRLRVRTYLIIICYYGAYCILHIQYVCIQRMQCIQRYIHTHTHTLVLRYDRIYSYYMRLGIPMDYGTRIIPTRSRLPIPPVTSGRVAIFRSFLYDAKIDG